MAVSCVYCGEELYEDTEVCSSIFGIAHIECSETEDPEQLNQDGEL